MAPAEAKLRTPRRGSARLPEGNGRPPAESTERRSRRTGGEWVRLAGRVALWAVLALIAVRGVGSILSPAPEPEARAAPAQGSEVRDEESRAFAATFAKRYLTYDTAHPEYREIALERYLAEGLDAAGGVEVPESGPSQAVEQTTVSSVRANGPGRLLVTVATTVVSDRLTTRYLTVPVERAGGGLVVYDYPSFVAAPARGEPAELDTEPLAAGERDAIEDVVGRFLAAYLSGRKGAIAYFLPAGTRLEALSERYAVEELESVKQVGGSEGPSRTVIAVVRARDKDTGAAYLLRYQAVLVYRDRWLVARVNSL